MKNKINWKKILLISVIIIGIIIGILFLLGVSSKICIKDNNCVKVDLDCCGCEMGGNSIAINKLHEPLWKLKYNRICENVACLAMYACYNGNVPRCVNNTCKLSK